jgi:AGZA family xanthine/uracil permease-like MFS transporter
MLPGLAGWGALLLKAGLRAGGTGTNGSLPSGPRAAGAPFAARPTYGPPEPSRWSRGRSWPPCCFRRLLVYVIEQRFLAASFCALVAALFSWVGLIHAWRFTLADTVLHPGWGSGREDHRAGTEVWWR